MNQVKIGSSELPQPQDSVSREYLQILKEPIPLDEKLTCIYTKAVKTLHLFAYKREPSSPPGYHEAYMDFVSAGKDEKASLWKGIQTEFAGYVKAVDQVNGDNGSNKHFLAEMRDHFQKIGAPEMSEKIQLVLNEHIAYNQTHRRR